MTTQQQTQTGAPCDDYVCNEAVEIPAQPLPAVAETTTTVVAAREGDQLPMTGGDVAGLAALGVAATLVGAVIVRGARRPTRS